MSTSTSSERGLISTLLQDPDPERLFQTCEAAGVTESSFVDPVCINVWTTAKRIRAERKPCILPVIMEEMHGDQTQNMMETTAITQNYPPSVAFVAHYIQEIRTAEHDRVLLDKARMAVEAKSKGGTGVVMAEQLKAASEAYLGGAVAAKMPSIVAAQDFMSERIPEPPQVVKKLFRAGQVGMMASMSKGGKTWALQSLALAVPNGMTWLGFETTLGRVLYVDPELEPYDGQSRLAYLADAMGLDGVPAGLDLWRVKGVTLGIRDMIPMILRRQEQVGKPYSLILLDSLYCLNGGRDENDNTEQSKTMQELYTLTAQTGAAVLVSHHFSKGNKSGTDHLDRASGAGVFARAPDVFMTLTPHQEQDCYTVEATCRSFAKPEPFVARWEFPLWRRAEELDPDALKRAGAGRGAQFTVDQIMGLLPPDGLAHGDWAKKAKDELGCGKSTFNKLIRKAKQDGMAVVGFGRYVPHGLSAEGES